MTVRPGERPYPAYRVFFAAAAVFSAAAVPLWALEYGGAAAPLNAGATAYWHGHERVFGYALAVVAGFLLNRVSRTQTFVALGLWIAARVALLIPGAPAILTACVSLAFPAILFVLAGLPFVKAAKSWDNRMFAPILGSFFVAELVYQLGVLGIVPDVEWLGLIFGVDAITLLMFAMGGRIIAAATSGAIQRKGGSLRRAAQARLERLGVAVLAGMGVADLTGVMPPVAGALAAVAAAIVFTRLTRWRFWRVIDVPEVSLPHLGYAWLGLGLAFKAASQLFQEPALADALHGVTVGALGTLTITIMTRTVLQKSRRPIAMPPATAFAVAMISAAAMCRLLAVAPEIRIVAIDLSAALWTAGFVAFAWILLPRPPARRAETGAQSQSMDVRRDSQTKRKRTRSRRPGDSQLS